MTKEPAEYKEKFKKVKQNLDRNLTLKRLIDAVNGISHIKQTIR